MTNTNQNDPFTDLWKEHVAIHGEKATVEAVHGYKNDPDFYRTPQGDEE